MKGDESRGIEPSSGLDRRLQRARDTARICSIGGYIIGFWAVVGLIFTLAQAKFESLENVDVATMYNLSLVNILTSKAKISQTGALAIAAGIVAELSLILIVSLRMHAGKDLVSALLLFVVFSIEVSTKFIDVGPSIVTEPGYWAWLLVYTCLAALLGTGVFSTWQVRQLSRELGEPAPSEP